MISCKTMGRYGNVLFQVAATTAHAWRLKTWAKFEGFEYHKAFAGQFNITEDQFLHKVYREKGFHYTPIPLEDNIRLEGYFQSEKYWEGFEDEIKAMFQPNTDTLKYVSRKYDHIVKDATAIHVRRGDYLELSDYHYNLGTSYYDVAVGERYASGDRKFIVFSDDIDWCLTRFPGSTFIHEDPVIDFFTMSRCKNFIIANSSFSWWASYLGNHPDKKVIAPAQWFGPKKEHLDTKDLYRQEMQVIDYGRVV